MSTLNRRTFVAASSAAFVIPFVKVRAATAMFSTIDGGLPASYPSQDPDLVREVVGKAHVNYDRVRELVTPRPALARAAWDWGFGDWESALGAASHMGRPDIAQLLIEHGARPNLFTFAMLGQVDVVRATCDANPGIQRQPGPHGITLLDHARKGGDDATVVVEYLEKLGDADIGPTNLPLDEGTASMYVGNYQPQGAPGVVFRVGLRRGTLTFQRDERVMRFLNHLGNDEFSPGGAASVSISFDVESGTALALTIHDGDLIVKANRLA
jgi:hypothetical protein